MDVKKIWVRARPLWIKEVRPLLVLALALFAIRSSLADWNDVPTGSMKPTILEGDRVYVNKLAYDLKVPSPPGTSPNGAIPGAEISCVLFTL
jgi:signal peptidase I